MLWQPGSHSDWLAVEGYSRILDPSSNRTLSPSRCHDLIDQELWPAEQRVEEAKLKLREAEVAAEQVKLALEAIGLEEQGAAVGLGDGALRERRASAHPPSTRSGCALSLSK